MQRLAGRAAAAVCEMSEYRGPMRLTKEARRLGENAAFAKKRIKERAAAKAARKARKQSRRG